MSWSHSWHLGTWPGNAGIGEFSNINRSIVLTLLKCKWWWRSRLIPGWPSMIPRPSIIPRSPIPIIKPPIIKVDMSYIQSIMPWSLFIFTGVRFLLCLTFRFQSKFVCPWSISPWSLFYCTHTIQSTLTRSVTRLPTGEAKLHLCLFLCVKSVLFLYLCFLWSP